MIDVISQLKKHDARLSALQGRTIQPKDWMEELASQIYALNLICLQQQEEIDSLKKRKDF